MPKRKMQKGERRIFKILAAVNESIAKIYESENDHPEYVELQNWLPAAVLDAAGVRTEPDSHAFRAKMLILRQFLCYCRCTYDGDLHDEPTPPEADVLLMSLFKDLYGPVSMRQPGTLSSS